MTNLRNILPKYGLGKYLLVQTVASVVTVSLVSMALLGFILTRTQEHVRQEQVDQSIETMKRSVSIQLQYFDFSTLEFTLQEMNRAIGFSKIEAYDRYGTLRATIGADFQSTENPESITLVEVGGVKIGSLRIWGEQTIGFSQSLGDPLILGLFLPIILFVLSGFFLHRNIRSKVINPLQELRELIRVSQTKPINFSQTSFQFREFEDIYGAFEKARNEQEHEVEEKLSEITKRLSQTTVLANALRNAGVAVSFLVSSSIDELEFLGTKLPSQFELAFKQSDFRKDQILKFLEAENCIVTEISVESLNANSSDIDPYTLQVRIGDHVCWRVSLVTTPNKGLALLGIDVSELYLAQNELFFKQRMDAMGALTSGVAHDFNNILAIILAGLENTNNIYGQDVQKSLSPVLSAAERGSGLVRQLLTFARKTPRIPEIIEPILIVEHFGEIMPAVFGQHIRLQTEVSTSEVVNCDRNLLMVAITNFLINARDAMPDGGKITLGVKDVGKHERKKYKLDSEQRYLDFYVIDEGQGISEEIRDNIFDPFFTTKDPSQGTGLGLSLVYNFAVESGGHLTYENQPEGGSCFHLVLPVSEAMTIDATAVDLKNVESITPRRKIFVVDDEVSLVGIIKLYFERNGHEVVGFNEVKSFLAQIETVGPNDVVLSDIHLPDGSGLEIAKELRDRGIACKLFLMSGNMDEGLHRASENYDAKLIEKPFQLSYLFSEIG